MYLHFLMPNSSWLSSVKERTQHKLVLFLRTDLGGEIDCLKNIVNIKQKLKQFVSWPTSNRDAFVAVINEDNAL